MFAQTTRYEGFYNAPGSNPQPLAHPGHGNQASDRIVGSKTCTYHSREDLFLEGDKCRNAFEILDGVICAYRLLPDGQRHVVAFYFPGDLIAHCCDSEYAFSAQALGRARVRRIPKNAIDRLIGICPNFARKMIRVSNRELQATRLHLMCVAAKSAEARMASFLLMLARRVPASGEESSGINLPMTRVDIGDYLGLTIETVSRTLGKFKRAGTIALPRTTVVQLRDRAELERLAQQ